MPKPTSMPTKNGHGRASAMTHTGPRALWSVVFMTNGASALHACAKRTSEAPRQSMITRSHVESLRIKTAHLGKMDIEEQNIARATGQPFADLTKHLASERPNYQATMQRRNATYRLRRRGKQCATKSDAHSTWECNEEVEWWI